MKKNVYNSKKVFKRRRRERERHKMKSTYVWRQLGRKREKENRDLQHTKSRQIFSFCDGEKDLDVIMQIKIRL